MAINGYDNNITNISSDGDYDFIANLSAGFTQLILLPISGTPTVKIKGTSAYSIAQDIDQAIVLPMPKAGLTLQFALGGGALQVMKA